MKGIQVLNTATGQMFHLSRGQLNSVLKKQKCMAAAKLKAGRAKHVVYALIHDGPGGKSYHIIPCTAYGDLAYRLCFGGRRGKVKPLAVHGR